MLISKIFNILYKTGCRHFFVATINEAIKIRKKYKKGDIYLLNGFNKNQNRREGLLRSD